MTIVSIGIFMATTALSVVSIGLPAMTKAFHTDIGTSQWIMICYLFTTSALLLNFGKIGDLFGCSRVYNLGIVLFSIASALCGISTSVHQLIVFRILQGVGGAMLVGTSTGLVVEVFPPDERGKALGIYVFMVGVFLTIGPSFGGFLVQTFSWRFIFLVNVPLGILSMVMVALFPFTSKRSRQVSIDFLGGAMLALFLLCFLLFLHFGQNQGWSSSLVVFFLLAFLAFFFLFIVVELKKPEPMLDLKIFRNLVFTAAQASNFLNHLAVFAVTFIIPFYLVDILNLSETQAGLIITPITLGMIVSPISGWLSDRIGTGIICVTGFTLICIGLFSLSTLDHNASTLGIMIRLSIVGVGRGIFSSPNNSVIMASVRKDQYGIAGAMTANLRHLGSVSGVAITGALFAHKKSSYLTEFVKTADMPFSVATEKAFMLAFHDALILATFISALGVIAAAIRAKTSVN